MPSSSLLDGTPLLLSFWMASSELKPGVGMPAYEVSGECGAVGPCAAKAPKKSYVMTLYQSTYWAAPP